MERTDGSPRGTAITVDDRRRADGPSGDPPAQGTPDVTATDPNRDLSAMPATEEGSMAALLGGVARAPSATPPVELPAGTEIDGAYRIVRRLGAGGMGVVYLARDLELQREVAVKLHRASSGTERLYREAVAMAQLSHPNVVTVHNVGRDHGRLYVAMEYVPGSNFNDWLTTAPRTWRDVVDMAIAAGEGLAAAHDAGFVHRDIKPHNILVGREGRPRVGDFGLVTVSASSQSSSDVFREVAARSASSDSHPSGDSDGGEQALGNAHTVSSSPLISGLTTAGTTLGTPAYMAPEQLVGSAVDARADQFAFCVVIYEALYGARPWRGGTLGELRVEVASQPPIEPPRGKAPAWIWPVLKRGLAADPAARYPDVRALMAALQQPPRRRALMIGAALAVVAVGAGIFFAVGRGDHAAMGSCDAAGTPAVEAWGPIARSSLAARYVRADSVQGPDLADDVAKSLDTWSTRWQLAAVTACQAIRDRTWSPAISDASKRCGRTSLDQFRSFVEGAGSSRPLPVDSRGLPDPASCADPTQLVGTAGITGSSTVIGTWSGDFGHLVLQQVGSEIWGVYEHDNGTVRGRMVGDTFVGWWCETPSRAAPGDAGEMEMRVIVDSNDIRAIAGEWRYGTGGDWDDRWDLTWDKDPAPAELLTRFDGKDDFCGHP